MSESSVTYRVDGPVAHVALSRPDKLNGLTLNMLAELVDIAGRIKQDRNVRAVVLTGEGSSFCAGLDFPSATKEPKRIAKYFVPVPSFVPLPGRGTNMFQRACWAWRELPVPVVAVIKGHCYGGGLQLALAADFRFTAADAELSVLEAKWGIIPDMTGTATLRELVGIDTAKLLTMTGKMISGTEAKDIGLVTHASDDPEAAAQDLIDILVQQSPDAVAGAKKIFNAAWSGSPAQAFATERRIQLRLLTGENSKIARKARMKGEAPNYRPRKLY
ncbi:crotonase/enoyl-CoA hydratase family protein [Hoyosella rhizosphaerae]|uniref:Enoyl-CoA hydratase/isomerase family protein n=1 Tax=Hoyosella rhizosphaerae TaxID=1755582 RepID=A0A916XDA9_9ACTN|nr:crotonase/enoyl-CoA hydratase family protein [Hoyosella rhizosphaerae]MBN4927712.1 crotonase/enoyl-CoA hydratase family protein [Hoyosella rhizosphaerae]GGC62216.1 enoyl-CoA hydratase/isomerase family protein [Hoyosella rhizosphaerae]